MFRVVNGTKAGEGTKQKKDGRKPQNINNFKRKTSVD